MLVALLPNQISDYWDLMKGDIASNPPPQADYGPYDSNRILYALMVGMMQCWLVNDKEQKTKGFVLTTVLSDVSGVRTLLIYNAIVLENASTSLWSEGWDTLVTFARTRGCSKIGSFIQNEKIIAMLEKQDFETRFVFVHKNI